MAEQSINTHRQRGQRHGTLPRFTQHRVNTQLTHRVNTQHPQSQSTAPTESAEAPSVSTHDMYFYTAHMIYLLWVHCKLARLMPAIGRHSPVRLAGGCGTAEGRPRPPVTHIYTENLNPLLKTTHTLHASYTHESMADQEPRPYPSRAAIRPRFIECVAYPSSAAAHALFSCMVVWRLTRGATVSVLSGARASSGSYSSRHSGLSAAPALPTNQQETAVSESHTTRRYLHHHWYVFPHETCLERTLFSQAGTHACEVGIATTGRCSPFISSSL